MRIRWQTTTPEKSTTPTDLDWWGGEINHRSPGPNHMAIYTGLPLCVNGHSSPNIWWTQLGDKAGERRGQSAPVNQLRNRLLGWLSRWQESFVSTTSPFPLQPNSKRSLHPISSEEALYHQNNNFSLSQQPPNSNMGSEVTATSSLKVENPRFERHLVLVFFSVEQTTFGWFLAGNRPRRSVYAARR